MDDSSRMGLDSHRRTGDKHGVRRFFRFDPTVSMGTWLTLLTMFSGGAAAYATYQSDKVQMRADIGFVKLTADRDRADLNGEITGLRSDVKDVKGDVKDVKGDIGEMKQSLAVLKAQATMPPRR